MSVTREEIARIAALASLDVEEQSLPALAEQLTRILDYVSQLNAVEAGTPAAFRPQSNAEPQSMRPDVVRPHDPPIQPKDFAPAFRDGLFLVPRVGGMGDGEGE